MTIKQKKFIAAYLGEAQFCATKAARIAGYKDPVNEGWRLKNHPDVLEALNEALDAVGMSEGEAVAILSDQARGSISPFLKHDPQGNPVIDISGEEAQSSLHLIKSVRTKRKSFASETSSGEELEVEITLYDKQAAAKNIAQIRGAFVQRVEVDIHDDGAEASLENKLHALGERLRQADGDSG